MSFMALHYQLSQDLICQAFKKITQTFYRCACMFVGSLPKMENDADDAEATIIAMSYVEQLPREWLVQMVSGYVS